MNGAVIQWTKAVQSIAANHYGGSGYGQRKASRMRETGRIA